MLSARELRLVEGATLRPRKPLRGVVRGERLAKSRGTSTEFSDYREYSSGDDLRHLDWNVLARLDSAVMRTYREEEDLVVRVLVDVSASMDFGQPTKRDRAADIGAAFALAALGSGDGVILEPLGRRSPPRRALRGRKSGPRALALAAELAGSSGGDGVAKSLRDRLLGAGRPTLAVVLTDTLDPDLPAALRAVGGRGHEIWLLQILTPGEVEPDLEGELELHDSESGATIPLTANRAAIAEYCENLARHTAAVEAACIRGGGRFARVSTDAPLDEIASKILRRQGWWS